MARRYTSSGYLCDGRANVSDILRRFPGLAILDGLPVPGIRFHVERGPRPHKDDVANRALRAQPFTFPFDVAPPLFENEMVANVINSFCAKFFPLFDNDRSAVVQAYAPQATMSISANTLPSRSFAAVERSKVNPTPTPTFEPWVKLPSRNMTRHFHTQEKRVATLHSGADVGELTNFLKNKVLGTRHPVADASKWCVEGWVVGGEGEMTRLCAVVRGEFEECECARSGLELMSSAFTWDEVVSENFYSRCFTS